MESEMLPLPAISRYSVCGDIAYPVSDYVDYDDHVAAMEAYARANVEAATEALRKEVEFQTALTKELLPYQERAVKAEAHAERLAEALDIIARVGKASRKQTTRTRWIVARAISALDNDEDWQALPKPNGFHNAILPTAERPPTTSRGVE